MEIGRRIQVKLFSPKGTKHKTFEKRNILKNPISDCFEFVGTINTVNVRTMFLKVRLALGLEILICKSPCLRKSEIVNFW